MWGSPAGMQLRSPVSKRRFPGTSVLRTYRPCTLTPYLSLAILHPLSCYSLYNYMNGLLTNLSLTKLSIFSSPNMLS